MNKVYLTNSYITNFKPKTNLRGAIIRNNRKEYKYNKIFSKNFFIFLLLIKLNTKKKINLTFFVKKSSQNVYTTIRSPYRHKLARHQLFINRYILNVTIHFLIKKFPTFFNINELLYFYKNIKTISN